jgi:cytochrome P450 family 142 subfamily A polypeptide 1
MTGPPDLLDGELYRDDPYPTYAWLREHAPLYRDANGVWGLSRYEDVVDASRHPELFSSALGSRPNTPANLYMIDQDDPRHARQRRLVYKGFTPRQVGLLEEHARQVVTAILDRVADKGECDFVTEVAAPLPMTVIGEMLGIERDDYGRLQHWSDEMIKGADGKATDTTVDAYMQYRDYESAVIAARRGEHRDDLAGILVEAEIDGERLDDEELLAELLLLLVGGNETTRNVISGAMEALSAHPDQHARLRDDPSLLSDAVEEFIRWVTPVINMRRTATADIERHGQTIAEGDQVLLMYGSANRDATLFDDPERFDVGRHPNPHLSFGFGPHFCLGASLARLEIKVMFEELLHRFPDMRVAPGAKAERVPNSFIRGITGLPVVFSPG